jgi:hypothetical protein
VTRHPTQAIPGVAVVNFAPDDAGAPWLGNRFPARNLGRLEGIATLGGNDTARIPFGGAYRVSTIRSLSNTSRRA